MADWYERIGRLIVSSQVRFARFRNGLKERRGNAGNHRVAYLEGGRGDIVVFLNGLGSQKDQWGSGLYKLTQTHRCFFVDLPGEGDSDFMEDASYDVQSQARRLYHFLEDIDASTFYLVGASLGGYLAALFAAMFPEKVSKLVLIDTAGIMAPRQSIVMDRFLESGTIPFGYRNESEMMEFWRLVFNRVPDVPTPIRRYLARRGERRYARVQKIAQDNVKFGLFRLGESLHAIQAPVLIVWGGNDKVFDSSTVSVLTERLSRSVVKMIPDAGHVPHLEASEEVFSAIGDFFRYPEVTKPTTDRVERTSADMPVSTPKGFLPESQQPSGLQ